MHVLEKTSKRKQAFVYISRFGAAGTALAIPPDIFDMKALPVCAIRAE